jgi:DNA-binding NarL/FixJ family response regulator
MQKIRALLVDDHPISRSGVRLLLESQPDIVVVGETGSGDEAARLTEELRPDVALVDVSLCEGIGFQAVRQVRQAGEQCAVLAFTRCDGEEQFFRAIESGAVGYLPKRAEASDLLSAVRAIQREGAFLHPTAARALLRGFASRAAPSLDHQSPDGLTDRETQVLRLVAAGQTNREIAEALGIAVGTVERHRANAMEKLDLHNRTEVIKYAIRRRLIDA